MDYNTIGFLELPPIGFLAALSKEERKTLSSFGNGFRIAPDERVIREGDEQNALYILVAGRLRVHRVTDGQEVSLGELRDGEAFGEMNIFDPRRASATVTGVKKSQVWRIVKSALDDYFDRYPEAGVKILRGLGMVLTRRLRQASEKIPANSGTVLDGWW